MNCMLFSALISLELVMCMKPSLGRHVQSGFHSLGLTRIITHLDKRFGASWAFAPQLPIEI